ARRNGLDRLVFFADREVPVSSNTLDGAIKDYESNTPQASAIITVKDMSNAVKGSATTDLEGRFSVSDLQNGRYKVFIEQQGRYPEIVELNVNGNRTLEWSNVSVNNFPMDLFEALFFVQDGHIGRPPYRLVKYQNALNLDYQIATAPTPRTRWDRQIPANEMAENIKLVKLLIKAGGELLYNVSIPESSIRDVGGNPRYSSWSLPSNFVVDWDDNLPPNWASLRYIYVISNNITGGGASFKTNLRTYIPSYFYMGAIKEIFGALGIVGDPRRDLGDPVALRYNGRSVLVVPSLVPSFEEGMRRLMTLDDVPNPGQAVFAILPRADQQVITLARLRPAGYMKVNTGGVDHYQSTID
ncbi:MAG: carboxypeptidase-like regulatory domain-containing protein, partial [Nanoarchaeota archaeon]